MDVMEMSPNSSKKTMMQRLRHNRLDSPQASCNLDDIEEFEKLQVAQAQLFKKDGENIVPDYLDGDFPSIL